jgi:hypothetical protein
VRGEAGQVNGGLSSGVRAADYEGPLAFQSPGLRDGRTLEHAGTKQLLNSGSVEAAIGNPGRNHYCATNSLTSVCEYP